MKEKHGTKLRKIRNERGLTRKQLAERLGVSENVIVNWEFGRTRIGADMLGRLSEVLDFDIDQFLEVKNPTSTISLNNLVVPDVDNILKRYYELDEHGKNIVRTVLEIEYERIKQDT